VEVMIASMQGTRSDLFTCRILGERPHGNGPASRGILQCSWVKILVLSDNHCNPDVSIGHMLLLKMLLGSAS